MFVNNRMASLIYKLVIIFVCLVGVFMNSGLLSGTFAPYVLLYYTIESNLLCLVFYIVAAIVTGLNIKNTGKFGVVRFAPHFKGGIVMAMMLTTIIYFFMLADAQFANASFFATLSNILVHLAVPLMVLADWIIFDKKGRFGTSDPVIWMVIPFMYYAIILVAAQLGVQYYGGVSYPYRFLDPDRILWAPVLLNVFLIAMGYLLLSYILFGADKLMGNHAKKKAAEAAAAQFEGHTVDVLDPAAPKLDNLSDLVTAPVSAPVAPAAAPARQAAVTAPVTAVE